MSISCSGSAKESLLFPPSCAAVLFEASECRPFFASSEGLSRLPLAGGSCSLRCSFSFIESPQLTDDRFQQFNVLRRQAIHEGALVARRRIGRFGSGRRLPVALWGDGGLAPLPGFGCPGRACRVLHIGFEALLLPMPEEHQIALQMRSVFAISSAPSRQRTIR